MSEITAKPKGAAHTGRSGNQRLYNGGCESLQDLNSFGTISNYDPAMRKCDPQGVCKHQRPREKPCIPCNRVADASCHACFDFGRVILPEGGSAVCKCVGAE